MPGITENNFISCIRGQNSDGLYLIYTKGGTDAVNIPVKECRFIKCIANGRISRSTTNDADLTNALVSVYDDNWRTTPENNDSFP